MILPYSNATAFLFVAQWDWEGADPEPPRDAEPGAEFGAPIDGAGLAAALALTLLSSPAPMPDGAGASPPRDVPQPPPAQRGPLAKTSAVQPLLYHGIRWVGYLVGRLQDNPDWRRRQDDQLEDATQRGVARASLEQQMLRALRRCQE